MLRSKISDVIAEVPENEFWKWNDCWSFSLQRSSYCAALAWWLCTGRLVSKDEVASIIGSGWWAEPLTIAFTSCLVEACSPHTCSRPASHPFLLSVPRSTASRLDLTTEEYLHSLIFMINDFSRLAVNAVTMADFATPLRLSDFVKDLYAGFGMLNLKNDSLRKRFDSIKVRKV